MNLMKDNDMTIKELKEIIRDIPDDAKISISMNMGEYRSENPEMNYNRFLNMLEIHEGPFNIDETLDTDEDLNTTDEDFNIDEI